MHVIIAEKRMQEIEEIMLKARDAKYSVPIRFGKVLFCGAAAAGKTNFLNLLMKEGFQSLHISTEVLKPQQVTMAIKAITSISDNEVEFKKMQIDDEIMQLESYLPKEYDKPKAPLQDNPPTKNIPKSNTTPTEPSQKASLQHLCNALEIRFLQIIVN